MQNQSKDGTEPKLKLVMLLSFLALISCGRLNDIENELDEHENRISALELLCSQFNTNISSLETITQALEKRDYVTSVTPILSEGNTVGYTITFNQSSPITIYNGCLNSPAPIFGTKEDNGTWYWTLNGEWLKDSAGNKIAVDSVTPVLKIEDQNWYVSCDNGKTWEKVGTKATSQMFTDVKVDNGNVILTLYDGTKITLPLNTSDYFNIPSGLILLNEDGGGVDKGGTFIIPIRVNPSNFDLKIENVDLKVINNIHTCYTLEKLETKDPKVDETIKSEFKVVAMEKDSSESGVYYLKIKADGNGNYCDLAQMYVIVKAKDEKGEERNVCSSSKFTITVLPTTYEGIHIEAMPQSLYYHTGGVVDKNNAKPFLLALMSNGYINKSGNKFYYDRTSISVKEISEGLYSTLDTSTFSNYGYVKITPDFSNNKWIEYKALESSQSSVTIQNQYVILERKINNKTVTDTLKFDFKVYLSNFDFEEKTLSISKDKLEDEETIFKYDYFDFATKAGFYEYFEKDLWLPVKYREKSASKKCIVAQSSVNKTEFYFSVAFYTTTLLPDIYGVTSFAREFQLSGQSKNGELVEIPKEEMSDLNGVVIFKKYYYTE